MLVTFRQVMSARRLGWPYQPSMSRQPIKSAGLMKLTQPTALRFPGLCWPSKEAV